jgi:hypothetical protein
MVDLKLLKQHGCTTERLREIFTCEKDGKDAKIRERLEDEIESRIYEGVHQSSKNANLYMAVDLAWDSLPINKATIPLLQYAQGKVDVQGVASELEAISPDLSNQFVERDEEGEIKRIDTLRLYEVSVNLIRSYVTRRVASQSSRFSNLFPYFKFDSRGTSSQEKLRADVLSQRVEMMTDQFGYRHLFEQSIREMFLYGHTVLFPIEGWTREVQWRRSTNNVTGNDQTESYVTKEGINFVNPHPTRVIWDNSRPLHNINDDLGPQWIGYWDIVRYGDIVNTSDYWNLDDIKYSNSLTGVFNTYKNFFSYYFDSNRISFPQQKDNYAFHNDRPANIGLYSSNERDKGLFVTNYFVKLNPKAEGIGDYPFDVWVKLVVASDSTVVHGEFLPSLPAVYGGINENDNRMVNISFAHEIMPFQDQLNNILTSMLHHMKSSMMTILAIDSDALDDDIKDYIKDSLAEDTFYSKPKALFYEGSKMADLGLNAKDFISVVNVQQELSGGINQSIQSVLQLLNLVERLLILSPQELGQAAPREISATEVNEMANSVNSIYSFISEGIDDMRAAVKKMLYEHLVVCSTTEFNVPVKKRYVASAVQSAGFEVEDVGETIDQLSMQRRRNVIGTPSNLLHEYCFTSRDGAERPRDVQSATNLAQLLQQILQLPEMLEVLGKERIFEMLNEIFRMSGAGYDLLLDPDEDREGLEEEGSIGNAQFLEQLKGQVPQLMQILKTINERTGNLEQKLGVQPEQPQQGLKQPQATEVQPQTAQPAATLQL